MVSEIHLRPCLSGNRHDAAVVSLAHVDLGHRGAATLDQAFNDCPTHDRNSEPRHSGLTMDEIVGLEGRSLSLAAKFAAIASDSSGVRGAWPKVLLIQAVDERWYPDPMVADAEAIDHVIVKWVGDRDPATRLVPAAEAPYPELARAFGLRCGQPLIYRDTVLVMPRFDRHAVDGQVDRYGQGSLAAAAGVAAFGQDAAPDDDLAVIKRVCGDPTAEVTE